MEQALESRARVFCFLLFSFPAVLQRSEHIMSDEEIGYRYTNNRYVVTFHSSSVRVVARFYLSGLKRRTVTGSKSNTAQWEPRGVNEYIVHDLSHTRSRQVKSYSFYVLPLSRRCSDMSRDTMSWKRSTM